MHEAEIIKALCNLHGMNINYLFSPTQAGGAPPGEVEMDLC